VKILWEGHFYSEKKNPSTDPILNISLNLPLPQFGLVRQGGRNRRRRYHNRTAR
jgi:hypothetical protein